ncbi:MAG TPA: OmpH family outer membrane protein [Flavobacteriia bacterium]|nr:OmpH family outer membrane protein [Flavobacteriia bacterium]
MIQKNFIFIILVFLSVIGFAQKPQKIGYLDMEYILENVPEYTQAQAKLDAKINTWNGKLDKIKADIETLETNLNNEKALLTDDLIKDREEDIQIKKEEFKALQETYFGPSGELFLLRKQIVKPVQDQVYNAVQEIAKNKKYDMILDKSSDLLMLYTNKKFDVSDLILNKIVKGRKLQENKEKKKQRIASNLSKQEQMKLKIQERKEKQLALREKIKKAQQERIRIKDSIRKARTAERLKKVNAAKNRVNKTNKSVDSKLPKTISEKQSVDEEPKQNINTKLENSVTDSSKVNKDSKKVKSAAQIKLEQRKKKRQELLDRLASQKRRKDSLKKAAAEKRAKKMKEIEERKKKLENK